MISLESILIHIFPRGNLLLLCHQTSTTNAVGVRKEIVILVCLFRAASIVRCTVTAVKVLAMAILDTSARPAGVQSTACRILPPALNLLTKDILDTVAAIDVKDGKRSLVVKVVVGGVQTVV
jgi:hypothetical protein